MIAAEIAYSTRLNGCECAECGIFFGIPKNFEAARRTDGKRFYCPNGHGLSWQESEADKLLNQLAGEQRRREAAERMVEQERRSHSATKGQLTKVRNRANAGVCLDCHRTFADVQRHRATKHPESPEALAAAVAREKAVAEE